jgi:hypothetical protein
MARKSINFFGLKRLGYVRVGPLPGHKKTVFQSRAMLGRYRNGAPQKSPNWGTSLSPKIPQIVEGLEGHRMTDHPGF